MPPKRKRAAAAVEENKTKGIKRNDEKEESSDKEVITKPKRRQVTKKQIIEEPVEEVNKTKPEKKTKKFTKVKEAARDEDTKNRKNIKVSKEPENEKATKGRKKTEPKSKVVENGEAKKKLIGKFELNESDEDVDEDEEDEKLPKSRKKAVPRKTIVKQKRKPAESDEDSEDDLDEEVENNKAVQDRKKIESKSEVADNDGLQKTRKRKKANSDDNVEETRKNVKTGKSSAPVKNKTTTDYEEINFNDCTKRSALGQEWNYKISNWNVDGLRAWLKKGGLDYLNYEKPDVLCLQETKCSMDKLPPEVNEVDGYKMYWQCSVKDGYAGVALFSKIEPISIKYGLDHEEHDDEGRIITAEYDNIYVISVYVPNAGRGLVTLPKRLKWNDVFKDYVAKLDKKKPVIVCGDMNVAHLEIDLANPKTNTKNAGFTKEERDGMTDFLNDGFIDTFRELYPDKTQAYTFWTYMSNCRAKNVGWRLDYFIVSKRLMDSVCDNIIRSEVFGSDHCPLTLFLNV